MTSEKTQLLTTRKDLQSKLLALGNIFALISKQNSDLILELAQKKQNYELLLADIKNLRELVHIQEETIISETESNDLSFFTQIQTLEHQEANVPMKTWISQRDKRRGGINQQVRRTYSIDVNKN